MRVVLLILLGACSLSVDYTGTYYKCGENGECPDGYICRAEVCIPLEPDPPACSQSISGGGFHTCSVRTDGTVWCWGRNDFGQLGDGTTMDRVLPVQVVGITNAKLVAAGYVHSCAVLTDGSVQCWGNNGRGQLGDGGTSDSRTPVTTMALANIVEIDAGDEHTCARDNAGAVWCWGENNDGECGDGTTTDRRIPAAISGLTAQAIAVGGSQSCAVVGTGLQCWGDNEHGQLGIGNTMDQTRPVAVGAGGTVAGVGVGEDHVCLFTPEGLVQCAGYNAEGQLGIGSYSTSMTFQTLLLPARVIELDAGEDHTCARDDGGGVWCWGNDFEGRLGQGFENSVRHPVRSTYVGAEEIATGYYHTCVRDTFGAVRCSGFNGRGALGNARRTTQGSPSPVEDLTGVTAIAAAGGTTCALEGMQAWCWGESNNGEAGVGRFDHVYEPTQLAGSYTLLAGGGDHFCAVGSDGNLYCWGWNEEGQLGDNKTVSRSHPGPVDSLGGTPTSVAAGDEHTCAVVGGTVKCWGYNASGQLGIGSLSRQLVPQTTSITTATQVVAGAGHSCALLDTGAVQCWGENGSGQLGNNSTTDANAPVAVMGLPAGIVEIAARGDRTFARAMDGTLYSWGSGCDGRLGVANRSCGAHSTPLMVMTGGFSKLAPGYEANCAQKSDGSTWCWGSNYHGQVGDGTFQTQSIPVQLAGLDATQIAQGGSHACALRPDKTVACWGYGGQGQLGNGDVTADAPTAARLVCGE